MAAIRAKAIYIVGKSKAKLYDKAGEMGITFKDVAGQEGVKVAALLQLIVIMYEREGEVHMADGSGGRYALTPIK